MRPLVGTNKTLGLLSNRTNVTLVGPHTINAGRGTYFFVDMAGKNNEIAPYHQILKWFVEVRSDPHWTVIAHQKQVLLFLKRRERNISAAYLGLGHNFWNLPFLSDLFKIFCVAVDGPKIIIGP